MSVINKKKMLTKVWCRYYDLSNKFIQLIVFNLGRFLSKTNSKFCQFVLNSTTRLSRMRCQLIQRITLS